MIELRIGAARTVSDRIFYWTTDESRCSFYTDVDPHLSRIGPPDPVVVDLVRLATLVYLADRTRPRPTFGWRRELSLGLPVSDRERWDAAAGAIADMLDFLSSDSWSVTFSALDTRRHRSAPQQGTEDVVLYSGGADGQAGAALAPQGSSPLLVALWDHGGVKGIQSAAYAALTSARGSPLPSWSVHLSRRSELAATRTVFDHEPSSRTRSLLYIAFGIAAASLRGKRLVIPENGFMSLNPPLLPERRGALSTRTTHPSFIAQLRGVITAVGVDVELVVPFAGSTKGEVFRLVADRYDAARASHLLSATHSCARPNRREVGVPPMMHCGVCHACLVRRGAFLASNIEDRTLYRERAVTGAQRTTWVRSHGDDLRAVRFGLRRGIGMAEVLALGLPAEYDVDAAAGLIRRGLAELELAIDGL